MTKDEKKKAAFERMTARAEKRSRSKSQGTCRKESRSRKSRPKRSLRAEHSGKTCCQKTVSQGIVALLQSRPAWQSRIQTGHSGSDEKELSVDDYKELREQYIDVVRTAFFFRTPVYTHPVKTEAANFLDKVMTRYQEAEWGLILGLLTEGYVSKTLAGILIKHSELIIKTGLGEFVFRFIKEIKERNGNLEEDRTVTPFTDGQKKRIEQLFNLYRPVIYSGAFHEVE